jgi:metal-dependent amidase/aminoacylase/carboxypeptidase family protein
VRRAIWRNNPDFDGTAVFIFQPAEESEGGAAVMIEDGLFEQFPVEAVYRPAQLAGHSGRRDGGDAGAGDGRHLRLRDHRARPRLPCGDAASGRRYHCRRQRNWCRRCKRLFRAPAPCESAVVSVTQFHGGEAWNIIPEEAVLRGTIRTFKPEVQERSNEPSNACAAASRRPTGRRSASSSTTAIRRRLTASAEPKLCQQVAAEVFRRASAY